MFICFFYCFFSKNMCVASAPPPPPTHKHLFFHFLDALCFGHGEDDTLEFGGFVPDGSDPEFYTNAQFFEFIHPENDFLPYTYDTFDFDYCEERGFSFS